MPRSFTCLAAFASLLLSLAMLALAVLPPQVVGAQTAPTPSVSAQELKAALAEAKRQLEQQGQAASGLTAGEAMEGLEAVRGRITSLAQIMAELRAERDELRAQLVQARDELGRAQQQIVALEKRRSAAAEADKRIASLEQELQAAKAHAEELATANAKAAALGEQTRRELADRDRRISDAQQEIARVKADLAQSEEAKRALSTEYEQLRGHTGDLQGELTRVKADAETGRAEIEHRLAAEIDALKQRLTSAEREAAELRSIASSSVEEVRALGQQLLAVLAEEEKLVAASAELSSIAALAEQHLTARKHDEQVRTEEPAPGAAGDSWRRTVLEAGIFVAPGSDQLATRATALLGEAAQLIRGSTGRVRIVGHMDLSGDADTTRRLSLRRAQAVRDYLVSTYGLDRARFTVEGKGSDEPVASNDSPSGRRANRRVELFVAG